VFLVRGGWESTIVARLTLIMVGLSAGLFVSRSWLHCEHLDVDVDFANGPESVYSV
jgi:hypothetical protein